MSALANPADSPLRFRDVLRAELAPREGRWATVTRMAVACAITVAIAMTFQIPQPTYMAYMVFLVSHDDLNATLTTGVGGIAAATLAILITLLVSLVDLAEPALRLPLMAAITFCAMYTTRTFALGPLTYLVGFVVVLLHTLIDDVPSPEAFTRATLWAWVVVTVPVLLTLVMNIVFGHDVRLSARRAVYRVLGELRDAIPQDDFLRWVPQWRAELLPLWEALQHGKKAPAAPGQVGTDAIGVFLETLTMLEAVRIPVSHTVQGEWVRRLESCLRSLDDTEQSRLELAPAASGALRGSPAESAVSERFTALEQVIAHGEVNSKTPDKEPKRALFVADAFSNP